jgi:hypothetical protein
VQVVMLHVLPVQARLQLLLQPGVAPSWLCLQLRRLPRTWLLLLPLRLCGFALGTAL